MNKLGLGLWPTMPPTEAVLITKEAARLGFDSAWVVESSLTPGKDAISYLGALAISSDRIRLGTGVINLFSRSATLIASTMATLDEMSNGRMILGIGTGHSVVSQYHSTEFRDPIVRMREYVEVIRKLISGERVNYNGKHVRVENLKLNLRPFRPTIPIYIATVSDRLARLAGEVGDGTLFVLSSTRRIAELVEATLSGAKQAGRSTEGIEFACYLPTFMMRDGEAALKAARQTVANYGRSVFYRRLYERMGYGNEAKLLSDAWVTGDSGAALNGVSEVMAKELTLVGSKGECVRRVEDYRRAGITLPIIQPYYTVGDLDSNVKPSLDAFRT